MVVMGYECDHKAALSLEGLQGWSVRVGVCLLCVGACLLGVRMGVCLLCVCVDVCLLGVRMGMCA